MDFNDLAETREQTLRITIARNRYLFNSSAPDRAFLMKHDEAFLSSLVTRFGWDGDTALVQWLLERRQPTWANGSMNAYTFEDLLSHRDCAGREIIHHGVMRALTHSAAAVNKRWLENLAEYLAHKCAFEKPAEILRPQRLRLIAHLLYYAERAVQEKGLEDYYFRFAGPFYERFAGRAAMDDALRRAAYYNLPGFRALWEEAKKDGDGIALPGEE